MRPSFSKKIALDLGSSKLRLVEVGSLQSSVWELSSLELRSQFLEIDACIVRRKHDQQLVAWGKEALAMRGRLDADMELIFPFVASHIVDWGAAKQLLRQSLRQVFNRFVFSPEVLVTTVAAATAVQRRLLTKLFYELGFAKVSLIAAPLAAAIGAGVPIADASGTLLLHLGASNVQFANIALDSVLFVRSSQLAGWDLDQALAATLRQNDNFLVSLESAQALKEQVWHFAPPVKSPSLTIVGKHALSHHPLELTIKATHLQSVINLFRVELLQLLQELLALLPPELIQDVTRKGVLLSGGLAQLSGLEALLVEELAMPVALLEDPELLALMGTVEMLRSGAA